MLYRCLFKYTMVDNLVAGVFTMNRIILTEEDVSYVFS